MLFGLKMIELSNIASFKQAWDSVEPLSSKLQAAFYPYSSEGGSGAAIAGEDFVVFASDTRFSYDSFAVLTRDGKKLHLLNNNCAVNFTGFNGDSMQVVKEMQTRMQVYKFNFHCDLAVDSAAHLLSRTLYMKRFFPFYVSPVLGGITKEGKGVLFRYDLIGMLQDARWETVGAASSQLDPFLDNQIGWHCKSPQTKPPLTVERAKAVLRDAFRSAAERETSTGDGLQMITLQAGQPALEEHFRLRSD